jgi:hypothetical protein
MHEYHTAVWLTISNSLTGEFPGSVELVVLEVRYGVDERAIAIQLKRLIRILTGCRPCKKCSVKLFGFSLQPVTASVGFQSQQGLVCRAPCKLATQNGLT